MRTFPDIPTALAMRAVFLSYRRDDTQTVTGFIYQHLTSPTGFGSNGVFMDIDTIPIGVDFRQVIEEHVGRCRFFLVVIGPRWLSPRLHQVGDFVRMEVESALRRGIPVVPVLVDGATMPKPEQLPETIRRLAYQNATTIRAGKWFAMDMEQLVKRLPEAEGWTKRKSGFVTPLARDDSPKFSTRCPQCTIRLTFRPEQAGKPAKCPKCLVSIELPKVDGGEALPVVSLTATRPIRETRTGQPTDTQTEQRQRVDQGPLNSGGVEDEEGDEPTLKGGSGWAGKTSLTLALFPLLFLITQWITVYIYGFAGNLMPWQILLTCAGMCGLQLVFVPLSVIFGLIGCRAALGRRAAWTGLIISSILILYFILHLILQNQFLMSSPTTSVLASPSAASPATTRSP